MTIFMVSYDLNKPGQKYRSLYVALQSYSGWCKMMKSTWLISTANNMDNVFNELKSHIDKNDYLVINPLNEYNGRIHPKVADWIDKVS